MRTPLIITFICALFGAPHQASFADTNAPDPSATPESIVADAANGKDPYLPDFSYAGYGFGLAQLPDSVGILLEVDEFGSEANDGTDDTAAIKQALQHADTIDGKVTIRFSPGRYRLTEVISLVRSDLTLQGAGQGEGGTELYFPRPLSMVDDTSKLDELREYLQKYDKRQRDRWNNLDERFSEYSWAGGFLWVGREGSRPNPYLEELDKPPVVLANGLRAQRGEASIEVDETDAFTPGQWVAIRWYSNSPDSGIIKSIYGETDLKIGSHHWSFEKRPLVVHRTKIDRIEGKTLFLRSPLPHPVDSETPAILAEWNPLVQVGIEELKISFPESVDFGHHVEAGYNAIFLTGAADSWVRNVSVVNADSGILMEDIANSTLADLRFSGGHTAHYAIMMGSVQHVLATNVDVHCPTIHPISFNTKSRQSVFHEVDVWKTPVLDQHAGSNHQNLFDRVTLHLSAEQGESGPQYAVFDGSGAGYWQPGHGRYNTFWNLKLVFEGGAAKDETVQVLGVDEGPDARVVGLHANRPIALDYRPQPLVVSLGSPILEVPSLYEAQLERRRQSQSENDGSASDGD